MRHLLLRFISSLQSLTLIILFGLSACSSPSVKDTNELSPGMSREKVVEKFGDPESTRGTEDETYLTYFLKPGHWQDEEEYIFVFDDDDKLKTYGKKGDFDSLEVSTGRLIQAEEEKK
jgi:outer membrane protein assembly factor BamE (lipoprotein component of BamABCDE complex)